MEYVIKFKASNSTDTEVGSNELGYKPTDDQVKEYLEGQGYEGVTVIAMVEA